MPPFPKPDFAYDYEIDHEIEAMRRYRDTRPGRAIPAQVPDRLLLATWNVANLGAQERLDEDHRLIAEIVSWFDLIAVQEVNNDLGGLREVHRHLPEAFRLLFSGPAGNEERLAFVYDSSKITVREEVGEIGVPPSDMRDIRLDGIEQTFDG